MTTIASTRFCFQKQDFWKQDLASKGFSSVVRGKVKRTSASTNEVGEGIMGSSVPDHLRLQDAHPWLRCPVVVRRFSDAGRIDE